MLAITCKTPSSLQILCQLLLLQITDSHLLQPADVTATTCRSREHPICLSCSPSTYVPPSHCWRWTSCCSTHDDPATTCTKLTLSTYLTSLDLISRIYMMLKLQKVLVSCINSNDESCRFLGKTVHIYMTTSCHIPKDTILQYEVRASKYIYS